MRDIYQMAERSSTLYQWAETVL